MISELIRALVLTAAGTTATVAGALLIVMHVVLGTALSRHREMRHSTDHPRSSK
jgi:hypothetical protein